MEVSGIVFYDLLEGTIFFFIYLRMNRYSNKLLYNN